MFLIVQTLAVTVQMYGDSLLYNSDADEYDWSKLLVTHSAPLSF